ncbi:MAG: hypothetical protein M3N34_07610 [Pseudomonadota bacterium]|nr:hypothetical protein [Pseudomonadota bacterium]
MIDQPNNDGRNPDGTFAAGNSLGGNRAGSRHRVTRAVEALLEGQHEALTAKAIDKALDGDMIALRLCLDRIAPPRKDSPIAMALPPVRTMADAVEASVAVLEAVALGDVTPDEAWRLMALLSAHRGIIETADLEARIAKLEKK